MFNRPKLQTERLLLRAFTLSDAKRVQELAGDKKIAETTLNIPHPYLDGMAEAWISSQKDNERAFVYAITHKETKELMGAVSLMTNPMHKKAELAYWVGVPYWNKGYGTEAANAIIDYGFMTLDLNKIYALSFETNPGSYRIMEKVGMKLEGIRYQDVIKDNEALNLRSYYLLKADYLSA